MYEFKKLDGEEIVLISDDSILKVDGNDKNISTILTNQRLLLFDYPSSVNNYQEAMKVGRGADYIKQKELILDVYISDIVSITLEDGYDKYLLENTNYFYLKDIQIFQKISDLRKELD